MDYMRADPTRSIQAYVDEYDDGIVEHANQGIEEIYDYLAEV